MQLSAPGSPLRKSSFRSPPPRSGGEPSATLGSRPRVDTVELSARAEEKPRGASRTTKIGLGLLAALSLTSSLAGLAGYAAQQLPLCQTESAVVAVENGGLCVSPEASKGADAVYRAGRGLFHRGDAIEDLASTSNRVLQPESSRIDLDGDGRLTVSTWNLHHGTSQNADGARDQLGEMIETLNETGADVDLLQEVLPWHAQRLVDGTGKVGYYSQTTSRQGNLILVSPDLEVTENLRTTLNHTIRSEREAASVVDATRGEEPRAAQLLRLQGEDTNGESVTVFNTHLSTGSASPEARRQEGERLQAFLQEWSGGEAVVGGGDLNMRKQQGVVQSLEDRGYTVEGATIDWLVSDKVETLELQAGDVRTADGTRVSDHPLVWADYSVIGSASGR